MELQKEKSAEVKVLPQVQRFKQIPSGEYHQLRQLSQSPIQSEYQRNFKRRPDLYFNVSSAEMTRLGRNVLDRERKELQPNKFVPEMMKNIQLAETLKPSVQTWSKLLKAFQMGKDKLLESTQARNQSELLRSQLTASSDAEKTKTKMAAEATEKRIAQRIESVNYWREELYKELGNLSEDKELLDRFQTRLTSYHSDLQKPRKSIEEVIYTRNQRMAGENVFDRADAKLLQAIRIVGEMEDLIRSASNEIRSQFSSNRASQHELELDSRDKLRAIQTDEYCQSLKEHSSGLGSFAGIENFDSHKSTVPGWRDYTEANLKRSRAARELSREKREKFQLEISAALEGFNHLWKEILTEMQERLAQTEEAKRQVEAELQQVAKEIHLNTQVVADTQKVLAGYERPLRLAETRIKERSERRDNMELCRDSAHLNLVEEVKTIKRSVVSLQNKVAAAQKSLGSLFQKQKALETELERKTHAIQIDRDKCAALLSIQPQFQSFGL